MRRSHEVSPLIFLPGLFVVIYLALRIAPYTYGGIISVIENSAGIFTGTGILLCESSLKVSLIFSFSYILMCYIYLLDSKNLRPFEEYGSARWGNIRQLKRKYMKQSSEEGRILSQNVSVSYDTRYHRRNLNVLVCGGSGSGKTRFYAKPNILEAENTSLVVLDPKGELLLSTGNMMREKGYDVRVLDLVDMKRSDCYNPFRYIEDDNDIQRLVTNIYENTTPKGIGSADPFWDNAGRMLLTALISYLHYESPPYEQNFSKVMDLLRMAENYSDDDSVRSPLDMMFTRLEGRDPHHIAVKYYKAYRSGSAKTLKSIQISLATHLEKFNLPTLSSITSYDDMDLPSLGEKKGIIYALIPDNDTSFNFMVGMLYTQLFQQLYRLADRKYGGALPVHVHILMDEFANVALPSSFDKLLSTMRSREISVSIILQNMAQLKALFEKEWESITGNCDEFVYLGGNEQSTHEYVVKMLGKETINYQTKNKTMSKSPSLSENNSIAGRDLMTADEVRELDNSLALVFIRGEKPVKDYKFDILSHRNIAMTTDGGAKPYEDGNGTGEFMSIGTLNLDTFTDEFFGRNRELGYELMDHPDRNFDAITSVQIAEMINGKNDKKK